MVYDLSTTGLALRRTAALRHHQPMVDKDGSANRLAYYLRLRDATKMRNADLARAISKRRGVEVTPQAVGKWWRDGKISGPNLIALQEIAGLGNGVPTTRAERIAQAMNAAEELDDRSVARLRTDITVLRKAVVILALTISETIPDVGTAFAEYLKATVPDQYYGERGFHALLAAGLPLAGEMAAEELSSSPALPVRRSARKARG
jgi:hypothetical protein